jgi:hypothetical protein
MTCIAHADIDHEERRVLAGEITAQRGSILHLYRILLHSPPVAIGWVHYLTAIRHECSLPGALRELAIMRVAILNGAPYRPISSTNRSGRRDQPDSPRRAAGVEQLRFIRFEAAGGSCSRRCNDP